MHTCTHTRLLTNLQTHLAHLALHTITYTHISAHNIACDITLYPVTNHIKQTTIYIIAAHSVRVLLRTPLHSYITAHTCTHTTIYSPPSYIPTWIHTFVYTHHHVYILSYVRISTGIELLKSR